MDFGVAFPEQAIPSRSKGKKWGERCVDWAAARTYFCYSPVRRDVVHMKINYDLVNGIIHMEDVASILNPGSISTAFVPDKIQHFPIINSKLNTLRGEEAARVFDWRVIVTNPYAISQIEEEKNRQHNEAIRSIVENTSIDEQQAQEQLRQTEDYFTYTWQDKREIQGNELLKHYSREEGFKQIFSDGFVDALVASVEAYRCGIVGGEPYLMKLNPMKLRVFRSGFSNRIEDADVIVYEDYWSRGRIVDTFYDELTPAQVKWLTDDVPDYEDGSALGEFGNVDDRHQFMPKIGIYGGEGVMVDTDSGLWEETDNLPLMDGGFGSSLLPYDVAGNVKVTQVWWRSKRLIYKVQSFDPETGEENYDFYPETYIPDESAGEKATKLWVNVMWEGAKIGEKIYVGIRPCIVQHNSLSNPSRCHAGIVGTIYNVNESSPYSLVDMMKPYNYLYDAIHAKLVDLIATNWGKILVMDLAMKPKGWEIDKWMYFARANKVLIKNSFNEGDRGAANGKIAGGLNNASQGYVDADWGQSIQNYINLLQWVKDSMSDLVGINRQREGNTYSRETVGGIERAVLQSSYITDWIFQQHEDTKRRVLECFLEEAKGALRGRSKKFQYILSDGSRKIIDIDGDLLASCDLGLVVDNSNDVQKFNAQIETIAQGAIQNQALDLASIVKLYASYSLNEKIRIIENGERKMQQAQAQAREQEMQLKQQEIQARQETENQKLSVQDMLNQRDNQTKIDVAEINARAEYLRLGIYENQNSEKLRRAEMDIDLKKIDEMRREFDAELKMKDKELDQKKEIELKKISAQNHKSSNAN